MSLKIKMIMSRKTHYKDRLESKRPTFLLVGLILALAAVYGLLNLKSYHKQQIICKRDFAAMLPVEEDVPRTFFKHETPPEEKVEKKKDEKPRLDDMFITVPDDAYVPDDGFPPADEPLDSIYDFGSDHEVLEMTIYAVEKKPVFPGCEDLLLEEERYACFIEQISKYVVRNFSPCESAFGITNEKLYIQFTIDEKGYVSNVKAVRGEDECNIARAVKALGNLPRMKPGEYGGRKVRTSFVLPINVK